jgi:cobalt-zinc-cadmium efflux system outer membrane protein
MRAAGARIALALVVAAAGGCATVPVRETFDEAAAVAAERTGRSLAWPEVSEGRDAVDARVTAALAGPLDTEAAVEVALLNNRRLHARYAELARAAAAGVQAGLPPNPFLDVAATFRDGSGGTPRLEISLVQEVMELFLLPARKRLAAVELERAKLGLAGAAVDLAAATRQTFLRYQAERQLLDLDRHALLAVEAAWEMAVQLRAAGNISELDLLGERDFYEQVKLDVSRREMAVADLREQLNERMGLWGERAGAWSAVERLPDPPERPAAADGAERRALERSLDVAAALLDLEASARRLGITDLAAVFPELEVGAEGEREVEQADDGSTEREWWLGPSLGLRLPIFDQGQPRRVAARMEMRQQRDELEALGVEVRTAARRAAAREEFARQQALYVRDVVLPLRLALTEQTQLHYNGMFVGVFQLLDAKRREIEAGRELVRAQRDYWLAASAGEQLAAGRLPGEGATAGDDGTSGERGEGAEEAH